MRVYELAKELGLSSKDLIEVLGQLMVSVKSHSSTLDEVTERRVREEVASRHASRQTAAGKATTGKAAAGKASAKAAPAKAARAPAKPTLDTPAASPEPARADVKTPTGERILSIRKIVAPPPEPAAEPAAPAPAEAAAGEPSRAPGVRPQELERPAAAAPSAAPAVPKAPAIGEGAPIRIAPVKPPTREAAREAARETVAPAEMAQIFEPTAAPPLPPAETPPREVRPVTPPSAPRRPERRLPPPPPPRRFHAERRQRRTEARPEPVPEVAPVLPESISLTGPIGVGELAVKLGMPVGEIVKKLLEFGMLAGINQQLTEEAAARTIKAFGVAVHGPEAAGAAGPRAAAPVDEAAVARAPVVTVMGHVDHGKTSLLDAVRATSVAAQEVGGITQHIGASTVDVDGRRIVFIDTPGHEAFTALRARGARVTDIAVLVVAADDGVMPQTVEAVDHARAAGVPIIVAMNKTDLPQANPDRVKQQLSDLGLVPEEWGGETVTVPVSARQRQGLKELLEMILLVADLHELRANPERPARGTILEARMDRGRGPVATVLVQEGTLRVGDAVIAGETLGRVRALLDERGARVGTAGPATPVEVVGLESLPNAGDVLEVTSEDRAARVMAQERADRRRATEGAARGGLVERIGETGRVELRLIVKADVHGSAEALQAALARLEDAEVAVSVLHVAVGPITESDVMLAAASRAVIVGFNVRPEAAVRRLAEQEKVEIRLYRIIYEVLDDLAALVRGLHAPKTQEVVLGQAEVRQTFAIPKVGTIAGCYVTSGRILRGASARLLREGAVVYQGAISSLRRFKDDVREVAEGFECGIGLERFQDIKAGDIIEAYQMQQVPA
ncbi:MAG TPA: translation initiation factor IF-2 [bacterium]|jgi:translation initiation factor IF-2|nr:translation initiation factor IF-2 [bacterium]